MVWTLVRCLRHDYTCVYTLDTCACYMLLHAQLLFFQNLSSWNTRQNCLNMKIKRKNWKYILGRLITMFAKARKCKHLLRNRQTGGYVRTWKRFYLLAQYMCATNSSSQSKYASIVFTLASHFFINGAPYPQFLF